MGFERIKADGYAFQIEMNYRFVRQGARIKEIPFLFLDRTRGDSKLSWKIAFEALWIVWWLRFANATGRL
jgi:dolichol-phosphate mannosyltransferase